MRFTFTSSLNRDYLFRRVYRKGTSVAEPNLVVYAKAHKGDGNYLGLTVTTKVGHAVVRNRIRRRLREIYRFHEGELKLGFDIVVVARTRAADADYRSLEKDFLEACRRLSLFKE